MLFRSPVQVPANDGKAVNVFGVHLLMRLRAGDTGGALSTIETHDAPGVGAPPHSHSREDETFQVLEGEYEFTVDGRTIHAKSGAMLFAPRGGMHSYRCTGQSTGRLSVIFTPGGFEGFFDEIGALTPQQQQDIPRVIEIGKKFGLEFPPPAA